MRYRPLAPFDSPDYRRPLHEAAYRGARLRARPYSVVLRWWVRLPFRRLRAWADRRPFRGGARRTGGL